MASLTRKTSATLRRLAPAVLLAAAATLTGSAVGDPAIACAESREWDIGAYDNCMRYMDQRLMAGDVVSEDVQQNHVMQCCEISGGVWDPNSGYDGACGAPPAAAPASPTPTKPGPAPRGPASAPVG